ncbi:MAG: hypothetical protein ACRDTE_08720 [Pseudonocardiaceae bacterium]
MPGARALLLIVLATLLTVLAGPSAAAYAEAADADTASVTGIAPNGDDATARTGHSVLPLPPMAHSPVPADRITLHGPGRADTVTQAGAEVAHEPVTTSWQGRGPPASRLD